MSLNLCNIMLKLVSGNQIKLFYKVITMKNKKTVLLTIITILFTTSCEALLATNKVETNSTKPTTSPSATSKPEPSVKPEEVKPVDLSDFVQKYSKTSKPEDIVKMFLDAIHGYFDANKKDKSASIIGLLINEPNWETQAGGLSFFRMKLKDMPHIFRSYAKGATPENNYQMDANNYEIEITKSEKIDENTQKVFIKSSGADFPRPITLKKDKEGLWIVHEFSSLYVDVRKPS
jgi:hypothetical protein